jgi:hypothetical protein
VGLRESRRNAYRHRQAGSLHAGGGRISEALFRAANSAERFLEVDIAGSQLIRASEERGKQWGSQNGKAS